MFYITSTWHQIGWNLLLQAPRFESFKGLFNLLIKSIRSDNGFHASNSFEIDWRWTKAASSVTLVHILMNSIMECFIRTIALKARDTRLHAMAKLPKVVKLDSRFLLTDSSFWFPITHFIQMTTRWWCFQEAESMCGNSPTHSGIILSYGSPIIISSSTKASLLLMVHHPILKVNYISTFTTTANG